MIPITEANTIPTNECTSAEEFKPTKVAAERVMRLKYVAASSMFV
jgi:hypothetical protein